MIPMIPRPRPQQRGLDLIRDAVKQTSPTPVAPKKPPSGSSAPPPRKTTKATKVSAPSGPTPEEIAAKERKEAEARAEKLRKEAEERARKTANNAARERATSDIERLNAEILAARSKRETNMSSLEALKKLVEEGPGSHASVRDSALARLDSALKSKLAQIQSTFETSLGDFRENLRDNEESEHDATFANLSNRARERQDIVTQALSQGAGESDLLRAQLQALRNWSANQADVNRSFFDTRASVNAGITDLNNQTRTGMMNEELSTNAARGQTWEQFYEAQGETYSDLADFDQNNYLLEQEIESLRKQREQPEGLLKWLDDGKNAEDWEAPKLESTKAAKATPYSSPYAQLAAEAAGSTWRDPGLSKMVQTWKGAPESTGALNTTRLWNAQGNTGLGAPPKRRPEGATLRRW